MLDHLVNSNNIVRLKTYKQWLELEGEAVGSTLTQTVFNGVNAFAGLTQFVLPSIMANVGWIFVPLMFAICATSLYTVSLLEACQVLRGACDLDL